MTTGRMAEEPPPAGAPLVLARKGGAPAWLFANLQGQALVATQDLLQGFFRERELKLQCAVPFGVPDFSKASVESALAIESADNAPIMAQLARVDLEPLRQSADPYACLVSARMWESRPLLLVVGKTDETAAAGAAEILKGLAWEDGALSVGSKDGLFTPRLEDGEAPGKPSGLAVARRRSSGALLFVAGKGALLDRISPFWTKYFQDRGMPVRRAGSPEAVLAAPAGKDIGALIAFETLDACPVAKKAELDLCRRRPTGATCGPIKEMRGKVLGQPFRGWRRETKPHLSVKPCEVYFPGFAGREKLR